MQITIRSEKVYGVKKYYPICEKACIFAEIAGTKTLTENALRAIKRLGYEIKNEDYELSFNF